MAQQRRNRNQQNNQQQNNDWAQQVPWTRPNLPYRAYGWEPGESGLPEFRDPSVARMPQDNDQQAPYYLAYGYYPPSAYAAQWPYQGNTLPNNQGNIPGPFQGVGPKGYQRSDQRIEEDVCERLTQHGYIDATDIEVGVDNGEVVLNGTVPDRRMKILAEDVADTVTGVQDVHNRLKIEQKNPNQRENQFMQQEFRQARGRRDQVGRSGVYPASAHNAPNDAQAQGMASWGQGDRGAAGYQDAGGSELDFDDEENT